MDLEVTVTSFAEHKQSYKDKIEGQRVVSFVDDEGNQRAELVWRVASGYTVEICEFAINREEDRRQGWGTKLMDAGLADMREYFENLERPHSLLKVWLLAEERNSVARAFYKARGFEEVTILQDFYSDGDAVMCVMEVA
jgi:ribosomal protein S18 acetylase RimI-like enzyme